MTTIFLSPLKTYSEKFTSSVVLESYFLTQGCSYDFKAVYLLVGSFTSNLDIRSFA